jgi:hypothetical protein
MQVDAVQPGVKAAIRSAAVLLAFSIAACEPAPPVEPLSHAQAGQVQTAQVPADPVLAYVSMCPIGKTAVIDDPAQGGNEIVVINTQYNAASGDICRTYATTSSSMQSRHLACSDGAAWQEISPLVTSSN